MSHTLTLLRRDFCQIHGINVGDEELFLTRGLQVSGISDATVDSQDQFYSKFSGSKNNIRPTEREAKIVKKCPVNLHNFEGSDTEKKQRIH